MRYVSRSADVNDLTRLTTRMDGNAMFDLSRGRIRRRVETVIGQLTGPFHFEKIRARDVWHLTSRIARKVLAHTLGMIDAAVGKSDSPISR